MALMAPMVPLAPLEPMAPFSTFKWRQWCQWRHICHLNGENGAQVPIASLLQYHHLNGAIGAIQNGANGIISTIVAIELNIYFAFDPKPSHVWTCGRPGAKLHLTMVRAAHDH